MTPSRFNPDEARRAAREAAFKEEMRRYWAAVYASQVAALGSEANYLAERKRIRRWIDAQLAADLDERLAALGVPQWPRRDRDLERRLRRLGIPARRHH